MLTTKQIAELKQAAEVYYPCACGIHVCGSNDALNQAITIANISTRTETEARMVFAACKAEAEARDGEPHDFVVDLNIGPYESHVEDFWISRQMLDRCIAAGRAALPNGGCQDG